jgi:hypothetical protein
MGYMSPGERFDVLYKFRLVLWVKRKVADPAWLALTLVPSSERDVSYVILFSNLRVQLFSF